MSTLLDRAKLQVAQIVMVILVLLAYALVSRLIFNAMVGDLFHTTLTFKQALGFVLLYRLFIH